jgi:BirA family transcriptional regulator, biotin operon repressor / biotin---[acetyl-CoA-carboxylase] ligase
MSNEGRARGGELFAADGLTRNLGTRVVGRRMLLYSEVPSTNSIAADLGETDEPEGTVVVAEAQTAGRGRSGRRWVSAPHVGLYTSILLRPPVRAGEVAVLSQLAAVSLAEAVTDVEPALAVRIKWPNDVLVRDRKAAGILVEGKVGEDRVQYAVIGIGVNVNHRQTDFPEELRDSATSLALSVGRPICRLGLAQALYRQLDRWYLRFVGGDRAVVVGRANALSATIGRWVRVQAGQEGIDAFAERINADGSLRVRLSDGEMRDLVSGDVSLREG